MNLVPPFSFIDDSVPPRFLDLDSAYRGVTIPFGPKYESDAKWEMRFGTDAHGNHFALLVPHHPTMIVSSPQQCVGKIAWQST